MTLRRWIAGALAVSVLSGAGAAGWYFGNRNKLGRPVPPLDIRYEAMNSRMQRPVVVSPTEEYPGPEGEIVYLTGDQFRAVSAASTLPLPGYDRRLAAAMAEPDPDRQSAMLLALFEGLPETPSGDETGLALYRIADGLLAAPPATAARADAAAELNQTMACRFASGGGGIGWRFEECRTRPSMTPSIVLVSVGGASMLVVLGGAFVAWRRSRRKKAPLVRRDEAGGDDMKVVNQ